MESPNHHPVQHGPTQGQGKAVRSSWEVQGDVLLPGFFAVQQQEGELLWRLGWQQGFCCCFLPFGSSVLLWYHGQGYRRRLPPRLRSEDYSYFARWDLQLVTVWDWHHALEKALHANSYMGPMVSTPGFQRGIQRVEDTAFGVLLGRDFCSSHVLLCGSGSTTMPTRWKVLEGFFAAKT